MRRLACLVVLLAATAHADPDAGLPDAGADAGEGRPGSSERVRELGFELVRRAARKSNAEGRALLEAGDPAGALAAFKLAYELSDQRDAEAANNAGYAWHKLNDRERAREWYERALALDPRRGLAWQNLAELYSGPGAPAEDLEKAAAYLGKAREFLGNKRVVVRLQARVAARQGRFSEAMRQYLAVQPQDDALALEIGDFLRDYARDDEAADWYGRVSDAELATEAEGRIRKLRLARAVAEFELSLHTEGIPARARQYLHLAGSLARLGDRSEAVRLLDEALALAPLYSEANVLLGDLLAQSEPGRAELAWLRALVVNGRNVDVLVRVAGLHLSQGRANAAASFLTRAVEVAPERNDLRLRLARAWHAAGNVRRALAHLETYLAEAPEGVEAREARALKAELEQAAPQAPAEPDAPSASPAEAQAVHRATRFIGEGRLNEALAELVALPEGTRGAAVYNLLAFAMRRLGRTEEAIGFYHASLAEDRDQPATLLAVGQLLLETGEAAAGRALLEEAELAGSVEAMLALARLDATPPDAFPALAQDALHLRRLTRARDRLDAYLDATDAAYRSDAATLLREVRSRVRAVWWVGGALGAGLVLLVLVVARRRWGGADLGELITRFPETGPEVQGVLSAIRHEVLKHNTMVLTGLVEAIADEEEAGAKAAWARQSLLGPPGSRDRRDAAGQRLKDYAAELVRIGRGQGLRLNLRRRDAAISALLKGFRLLERAAPALDRYDRLGRGGRRRLQRTLEHATRLLNVEGYEAVRALLDRLRLLRVDAGVLETIYTRTRREPAFGGAAFAPFSLEGAEHLPCAVAMPRRAFEDVVGNLVRNAIQTSVRQAPGQPVHIGFAVDTDVDFITGLEWLALRIRDRSPHELTVEMLRGRYIEEGLGLTADLVSRYDGALDVVEDAAPWTKAVVVRLPRVDDEDGGDDA
ncbi:MAG: tetratricopeptide repeat protein [Myxococcales bacterium]|nr:tetratricopeptide repeat protein [Myxococcales bacterium]